MDSLINPEIVGITIAWTAGFLRLLKKVYPVDLSNIAKMVVSCIMGALIGIAILSDLKTLESIVDALKIGFISGFSATTGYMAIKNLFQPKKENITVSILPI